MNRRALASCMGESAGAPPWNSPRFIRMKELPQTRDKMASNNHLVLWMAVLRSMHGDAGRR
mgnify:CR=1 FL=1